ncbi:C40 family peptidase [Pararhodonellum marinum]|uniref:C40 family peptidase n=1 Tax=Pararhodonellum marinum TaxID=2755358 RepID=UPI00188E58D1|nr:C40 family peptidase [Pararhodonellum marinum]
MMLKVNKFNLVKYLYFLIFFSLLLGFSSCSSSKNIRNLNVQQVIETAQSYRGTPYRYGGTTRSGIDCSALVYHSFASVGVTLPRTSADQSKIGKRISRNHLREGDVIFFATAKRGKKVTHAGIVTSTRGKGVSFIHASTSLGVTEDNINTDYWSKAYLFARRVF